MTAVDAWRRPTDCLAPGAVAALEGPHERPRPMGHRLNKDFVHRILNDLRAGALDARPPSQLRRRPRPRSPPGLLHQPVPKPSPPRRWGRPRVGDFWQHDSSIHPGWPADSKQTLVLTVDDHSRKDVAATFVLSDTTWDHFGHEPSAEGRDPKSEFLRALTALGFSHLVAPSPRTQGKIERRFRTSQGRVVALLMREKVQSFAHAHTVLQAEIDHLSRTGCRTTGMSPNDRWGKASHDVMTVMQDVPNTARLDLHRALHDHQRRKMDNPVDFEGRSCGIAHTHRKNVIIIHCPGRPFWGVTQPPATPENRWPEVLGKDTL